jgi:RND family efflux transporter MFP subunit
MFNKNLVLLFFTLCFAVCANANNNAYKIAVRSFKVEPLELYDSFNAVGQAKFKQSRTYYANVEGRVSQILSTGTSFSVKEGETILAIDPQVAISLKKQKEQAYDAAKFANVRNQKLFDKKFISEEALENSKAKLSEAKANLASSEVTYNDMIITAPFAGEVGVIALRIGDNVKKGDYLFSLIDKKEINIFLELPESLYSHVGNDTSAILTDDAGNSSTGKVLATTPYISDKGTMSVEVATANDNKFLHGSYLNVQLILNKHKGLAIPESAVLKNEKGSFVYKIEDNNIVRQLYVNLGTRTSNMIEVLSVDIKDGDLIVLEGLTKVQEGAQVEVIN